MLNRETLKSNRGLVSMVRAARRINARATGKFQFNFDLAEKMKLYSPDGIASPLLRGKIAVTAAEQTMPLLAELVPDPLPVWPIEAACKENFYTNILAQVFTSYGSDKSTNHNYEYLYADLLHELRHAPLNVLEIGLGTNNTDVVANMGRGGSPGASVRAFRDFLPQAMIYGADIDGRILFEEHHIKTFQVDQTDSDAMELLAHKIGRKLHLIIDDGLHCPHANLGTLHFAINHLDRGGTLVIEDIRAESVPIWQLVAHLLPDWRCRLIEARDGVLFVASR